MYSVVTFTKCFVTGQPERKFCMPTDDKVELCALSRWSGFEFWLDVILFSVVAKLFLPTHFRIPFEFYILRGLGNTRVKNSMQRVLSLNFIVCGIDEMSSFLRNN